MLSYVYVYILRVQAGIPRKNRFQSNIINKKRQEKKIKMDGYKMRTCKEGMGT